MVDHRPADPTDPVGSRLAALVASHPGAAVVDVGGGSGTRAVPLAMLGCTVTVVDSSTDALASLARRSAEAGVADRVRGVQGDADQLSALLPEHSADLVLCHHVVESLDDPGAAMAAVAGVLRPGGRVSVLVAGRLCAVLGHALAGRVDDALAALDGTAGTGTGTGGLRRFDVPALSGLLQSAGLSVESIAGVGVVSGIAAIAGQQAHPGDERLVDIERRLGEHPVLGQLAGDLHAVAVAHLLGELTGAVGQQSGLRKVTDDPDAVDDAACTILHVDMDAFFAAVELRRRPELAGRPMMVAGSADRGVVLSATYEARTYGVRSAMPTAQALARCPGIVVIPPDHDAYHRASRAVMGLFTQVTPLVEPLSVDEAFLDVAGARRLGGRPGRIAVRLRERIRSELGLIATVGAASTKFVAKLASGLAKPDGLLIVPPEQVRNLLRPLPVRALWGVGPQTAARLSSLGLTSVGEIADTDPDVLARALGRAVGHKLHDLAIGHDDRVVQPESTEVSIGSEVTFATDLSERSAILRALLAVSEKAAGRARQAGMAARTISVKIRFADFTTLTRSETLTNPTDHGRDVYAAALRQWDRLDAGRREVRLLGVRLEGLVRADTVVEQLELGSDGPAAGRDGWKRAEGALDRIAARFPGAAPRPASLLPPPGPSAGPARDADSSRR